MIIVEGFATYNYLYVCSSSEVHFKWIYGRQTSTMTILITLCILSIVQFKFIIRYPRTLQTELRTCCPERKDTSSHDYVVFFESCLSFSAASNASL
jgi:hypothetical protein